MIERNALCGGRPEDIACPEGYMDLVKKSWHQEPGKRPVVEEVIYELADIKGKVCYKLELKVVADIVFYEANSWYWCE